MNEADSCRALITHNDLTVMATQARYLMAYEFAGTTWERIGFWDKEKQLGREMTRCLREVLAAADSKHSHRRASYACL